MSGMPSTIPLQQAELVFGIEPSLDPTLELVLRRVRLRACRRAAWLRKLWAEEGEPGGKLAVTHAEMDTHLAGLDSPEAEAAWLASDPSVAAWNRELAEVETALAGDEDSPLAQLQRIFGLSVEDADIFQACLAQALDPSLGRVYAYLHDHAGRGYVSQELVARLFGYGRAGLWNAASPLCRWELVQVREVAPGEPPLLACDPLLRDWLQSRHSLDPYLVGSGRDPPAAGASAGLAGGGDRRVPRAHRLRREDWTRAGAGGRPAGQRAAHPGGAGLRPPRHGAAQR